MRCLPLILGTTTWVLIFGEVPHVTTAGLSHGKSYTKWLGARLRGGSAGSHVIDGTERASDLVRSRNFPGKAWHELECPMNEFSHGNGCSGVMFDVEAVGGDIFIDGIKAACDDDKGPCEYVVFAFEEGSWLDRDFERLRTPSRWRCLTQPRRLRLADNPLLILDDGNVELPYGNYSAIPFDLDSNGDPGGVLLRKGERKALYVHGRQPGSLVFRHPVRDLGWTFEDADQNGYEGVWEHDDTGDVVQWHYDPDRTQLVQTDSDGRLAVYAGTSFWEIDPFSNLCPVSGEHEPYVHSVAGFVGNITYSVL